MGFTVLQGPIIRAGESLSEPLDCTMGDLLRITMPADWDEAPLTFQISSTNTTIYNDMFFLDGFETIVPTVVPNAGIVVPVHISRAIGWIKFRSGTRMDPVVQSAERLFRVAINTYTGGPG